MQTESQIANINSADWKGCLAPAASERLIVKLNTVLVECRALWGSPNQAAIYRSQKYTPEEAGGGAWV